MLDVNEFWLFLSASFLLWITPGPDTIYILTRTLSQGRLAGLLSVFGVSAGILVHAVLAVVGLSVILASSSLAFTIVKVLGAAYLIYLGVQVLRSDRESSLPAGASDQGSAKIFRQGFLTNLLNPKIAMFFIAFLPQFLSPDSASREASTFLFLVGIFVLGGTLWCLLLVSFATRVMEAVGSNSRLSRSVGKATGLVYIALGLNLLRAKL